MAIARVKYADGAAVSPGSGIACSSGVEPQLIIQGCRTSRKTPQRTARMTSTGTGRTTRAASAIPAGGGTVARIAAPPSDDTSGLRRLALGAALDGIEQHPQQQIARPADQQVPV